MVRATLLASEVALPHSAVNVGTGRGTTVAALFERIRESVGSRLAPDFEAPRPEELRHSVADTERARAVLGFSADTPLDVEPLVAFWREKLSRRPG